MSYLWVGYGLTWLALAAYAWRLERRRRTAARELSFQRESAGSGGDGAGVPGDVPGGRGDAPGGRDDTPGGRGPTDPGA